MVNAPGDVLSGSLLPTFTDPGVDPETGQVSRHFSGSDVLGGLADLGTLGLTGNLKADLREEDEILGNEPTANPLTALNRSRQVAQQFQQSENIPAGLRTAVALGTDPLFLVPGGTIGKVSSTGGCNSVLEFSGWGHEAEGLTGAGVQFQGDAVQVLLAVR